MVTLRKKARKMGKREITKLLKAIPAAVAGESTYKAKTIRTRFFAHVARKFFFRQYEAFKTKSEGDADEFGNTWKPISEKTRIYRQLTSNERKEYKVGKTKGRGLLSAEEDRRWKRYFAKSFHLYSMWMDNKQAKSRAAKFAWAKLKEEGARTKKDLFKNRKGTILVNTGRLLKSFTPSEIGGGFYKPVKDQIALFEGSKITFGTKVPYASYVNKDRPILPSPDQCSKWVQEGVQDAMRELIIEFVENVE